MSSEEEDDMSGDGTDSQDQKQLPDSKRLVGVIANVLLVANKNKIPIKKSEIAKLIPKEYKRKTNQLITDASTYLQKVFGYKIIELEKKRFYFLSNQLECDCNIKLVDNSRPINEAKAIFIRTNLLIAIFMNLGLMNEGQVNEYLKKFGVDIENKRKDPKWGDVHKFIYTDLVRQCYIDITERTEMDPPVKEIRWGQRAKEEMNREKILDLVCKVYRSNIEPKMWTEQFKMIREERF